MDFRQKKGEPTALIVVDQIGVGSPLDGMLGGPKVTGRRSSCTL